MPRTRVSCVLLVLALASVNLAARRQAPDATAVARAVLAAIDAGDLARTGALLDDSFHLYYHGVPDPISKNDFLASLRSDLATVVGVRHDVQQVLPSGDRVTVRLVVTATHQAEHRGVAATGRRVTVAPIHILHVVHGRVTEWWAAEDDLGLLRQIGMVITPPSKPDTAVAGRDV